MKLRIHALIRVSRIESASIPSRGSFTGVFECVLVVEARGFTGFGHSSIHRDTLES